MHPWRKEDQDGRGDNMKISISRVTRRAAGGKNIQGDGAQESPEGDTAAAEWRHEWERPSGTFAFPPTGIGYGRGEGPEVAGRRRFHRREETSTRGADCRGSPPEAKRKRVQEASNRDDWR